MYCWTVPPLLACNGLIINRWGYIILPCTSSYSLSCFAQGRQQQSSPSVQVCWLGRSSGLVPEVSVLLWSRRQHYHRYRRLRDDTVGQCVTLLQNYKPLATSFSFPAPNVQFNKSSSSQETNCDSALVCKERYTHHQTSLRAWHYQ